MVAINAVTSFVVEGDVGVLTIDSPPVNALSAEVREGLVDGIAAAACEPAAAVVVLICAGRTFIAGADIAEFGKEPRGFTFAEVIRALEDCPKPVVAAVHGTALGGGLEVALGCHYRVAVKTARFGLPEVKLGLLPGAGGTQRLPRLIGVPATLEMVTSGKQISAEAALADGLIDAILEDLRGDALAFAARIVAERLPLRRVRDLDVPPVSLSLFTAFRAAKAKAFRGFEAPEACVQAVEAAATMAFDEGLALERRLFVQAMAGLQSKAQRYVFFAERLANKVEGLDPKTPLLPIESVGIVGAGTMGGGIAMTFLNAGVPVTIVEAGDEALARGVATIRNNYQATAAKGRLTSDDVEARMGLLAPSLDLDALSDADLIIEAVLEDMSTKREVFGKLDGIAKPGAILASNTSYLNVDTIAAATSRPGSVLGLHFFSPANVMRLLEVVRGAQTDAQALATAMATAKSIGKIAVVARVCDGFIGNRMLSRRQEQATALAIEGALPADIDRVLYDFGFPMGPFQMSDLAGLDIGWNEATSRGATLRDRLCEAGMRGQKNGCGFYDYDASRNRTPSPLAERIILDFAAEQGVDRRRIGDTEILERCLYPMISEGAEILAEGVAQRASDIDIVWINGYGWPVYRGGPMFWADSVGLREIAERLRGYGITPAPRLVELAAAAAGFTGAT